MTRLPADDVPRAEAHSVGHHLIGHVLCNQAGLDAIRANAAEPSPFVQLTDLFSGWKVYLDECPCD